MSLGGRHSRQREQGPRLGDREAGWKWFNLGSVLELREQEVSQRGESETTLSLWAEPRVHTPPGVTGSLEDFSHRQDPIRSASQNEHSEHSGDTVERGYRPSKDERVGSHRQISNS